MLNNDDDDDMNEFQNRKRKNEETESDKRLKSDKFSNEIVFKLKSNNNPYFDRVDVLCNKPLPDSIINKINDSSRENKIEYNFVLYKYKTQSSFYIGYLYTCILIDLIYPNNEFQNKDLQNNRLWNTGLQKLELPYEITNGVYVLAYRVHDSLRKENVLDFSVRAFTENICVQNIDFITIVRTIIRDM